MKDLMNRALDLARLRGANYADIRVVHNRTEDIVVRDGVVESINFAESEGFGVRVLVGGAWGFASSRDLSPAEVDRTTAQALEIAAASALVSGAAVELGPAVTSQGVYATPVQVDPFSVPLEDKLALLIAADAEMAKESGVRTRRSGLSLVREHKYFANTEGAFTEQTITETGGGIQATAVGNGEVQMRSYPNSFARQQVTGGWEELLSWDLPGNGARVASEAVALLTAEPCPSNLVTTLILGGSQLGLQIHESCGHPTELDRVYGSEAAYAGTSFLTTEKLDRLQYGSPLVNLTADSVRPLGLGTFGWDDEGVPAQTTPLVKDGLFVGYLMSRETASRLGKTSNACMRASGWNRIPIIRMVNVSLEPGDWTFENLIADTDDGIYMELNRSWSIDDKRYNFQFGTEIGYEIKNGKLGRMLRPRTWCGGAPASGDNCGAGCTTNCGKGQPGQVAHTGHGAAPARFRNIKVGVLK